MSRRRKRSLTPEETTLWQQVAATTTRRHRANMADAVEAVLPKPAPTDPLPTGEMQYKPQYETPYEPRLIRPTGREEPRVTFPKQPPPKPSGLDRATETRLRRGKREPDARLDLHGMTANHAHMALNRFISQSRTIGHRCVLVITGKGGIGSPRAFGENAPGVLRREVPVWLSTPPLSGMIVNVSQAHPKHGGGGALYVYLKRQR